MSKREWRKQRDETNRRIRRVFNTRVIGHDVIRGEGVVRHIPVTDKGYGDLEPGDRIIPVTASSDRGRQRWTRDQQQLAAALRR